MASSSSPISLMNSQSIPYPDRFHLAASFVDKTYGDLEANTTLTNDNKLILFALRQQAEVGPCNEPAPYMWNVTARYKHGAWKGLGNMSVPEAMVHYVRHIESMHPKWVQSVEYNNNNNDEVKPLQQEVKIERGILAAEKVEHGLAIASVAESGENAVAASPSSKSDRDDASSSTTTTTTSRRDKNKKLSNEAKNETSKTKSRKSTLNVSGNIVDFSLLSDSQLVSVVQSETIEFESGNSEENNQFFVPNHVARGLVSEILRLRRSVVMMSAAARLDDGGNSNLNGYQSAQRGTMLAYAENENKASSTRTAVEHVYYSDSNNKNREGNEKLQQKETIVVVEKTLDRDAQPVSKEENSAQNQNVEEQQPKSGWFSWLF